LAAQINEQTVTQDNLFRSRFQIIGDAVAHQLQVI
jgi:hypothetical protein